MNRHGLRRSPGVAVGLAARFPLKRARRRDAPSGNIHSGGAFAS